MRDDGRAWSQGKVGKLGGQGGKRRKPSRNKWGKGNKGPLSQMGIDDRGKQFALGARSRERAFTWSRACWRLSQGLQTKRKKPWMIREGVGDHFS